MPGMPPMPPIPFMMLSRSYTCPPSPCSCAPQPKFISGGGIPSCQVLWLLLCLCTSQPLLSHAAPPLPIGIPCTPSQPAQQEMTQYMNIQSTNSSM